MMGPRDQRLRTDYERMLRLQGATSRMTFRHERRRPGNGAPDWYSVTFRCKGIEQVRGDDPQYRREHVCEITLSLEYPDLAPLITWVTPVWHPNISAPNVCINAHAWDPTRFLDDTVVMLYDMARYAQLHDQSDRPPYPYDLAAATWCRRYRAAHPGCFPLDQPLQQGLVARHQQERVATVRVVRADEGDAAEAVARPAQPVVRLLPPRREDGGRAPGP